jgi:hypothetical protein
MLSEDLRVSKNTTRRGMMRRTLRLVKHGKTAPNLMKTRSQRVSKNCGALGAHEDGSSTQVPATNLNMVMGGGLINGPAASIFLYPRAGF